MAALRVGGGGGLKENHFIRYSHETLYSRNFMYLMFDSVIIKILNTRRVKIIFMFQKAEQRSIKMCHLFFCLYIFFHCEIYLSISITSYNTNESYNTKCL